MYFVLVFATCNKQLHALGWLTCTSILRLVQEKGFTLELWLHDSLPELPGCFMWAMHFVLFYATWKKHLHA